jgi:hypothetical protein
MPHFKSEDGLLYFLSEEDIANGGKSLLPDGCTLITDQEADGIQNPPPSEAQIIAWDIEKLRGLLRLSLDQRAVISARISILQDAFDNIGVPGKEEFAATESEQAELIARIDQLSNWKNYAILLGRVAISVNTEWPDQPEIYEV